MSLDNLLLQTADVLEKTAAYIENLESTRLTVDKQARYKTATDIAEKVSSAIGEPATSTLAQKIAEASPDVQELLIRMAGSDTVDSLGGPDRNVKQASESLGMPPEDARFVNWLTANNS